MIHHAPPRLTPQQAFYCRQCRVVETSTRLSLYFTPQDREWARSFARKMLRETIGKDWRTGEARLGVAAAFGSALIRQMAQEWHTLLTDARDVYCYSLMQDRITRYLRLYGGEQMRRTYEREAMKSQALAARNN